MPADTKEPLPSAGDHAGVAHAPYATDSEKGGASEKNASDPYLPPVQDAPITQDAHVQRKLSQRHLQLISLAGAIGSGLVLSSGTNLAQGGPLGLMLSFIIVGSFVCGVMMALSEMACLAPTSGSFIRFAGMFVDRSLAFSAGFTLVWGCSLSVASEVSAMAVVVQYWTTWAPAFFITIFLIPIVLANCISIRWLGEAECTSLVTFNHTPIALFLLRPRLSSHADTTSGPLHSFSAFDKLFSPFSRFC